MLTRQTDISTCSVASLALLTLTVLFAAIIGGLPFSHQFCHESLVEPEDCPACLLQSGLVLLLGSLALVLVGLNAAELSPPALRRVPFPLFSPRFTHLNRGPPALVHPRW